MFRSLDGFWSHVCSLRLVQNCGTDPARWHHCHSQQTRRWASTHPLRYRRHFRLQQHLTHIQSVSKVWGVASLLLLCFHSFIDQWMKTWKFFTPLTSIYFNNIHQIKVILPMWCSQVHHFTASCWSSNMFIFNHRWRIYLKHLSSTRISFSWWLKVPCVFFIGHLYSLAHISPLCDKKLLEVLICSCTSGYAPI